jgi:hypothetical protein
LGFDRDLAERPFRSLLPEPAGVLGQSLEFEDGVYIQDANFFAQVFFPQEALQRTVAPPQYEALRFSNFGDMVAVTLEDAAEASLLVRSVSLLRFGPQGLTIRMLRSTAFYRWSDIETFGVTVGRGCTVGFNRLPSCRQKGDTGARQFVSERFRRDVAS